MQTTCKHLHASIRVNEPLWYLGSFSNGPELGDDTRLSPLDALKTECAMSI